MARRLGKIYKFNNREPYSVQFTKHLNNLLLTYPDERKAILALFVFYIKEPEYIEIQSCDFKASEIGFRVKQLVGSYGPKFCMEWFTDVYGWNFKKKQVV